MAEVPPNEQMWMCEDCGAEYKRAPIIDGGPHASLVCRCGATNTIREFVRMPGLRCPQCFHVSIDQGGGIACEGRAMERLLSSRPKEPVWLVARVEESRDQTALDVGPQDSQRRYTLDEIRQMLSLRDVVVAVARARWDRLGREEEFDDLGFVRHTEGLRQAKAEIDLVVDALAINPSPEEAAQPDPQPSVEQGVVETCHREFPERDYERCGKPAKWIVWGKLFDKEALGPRCEDCARDQLPADFFRFPEQYAAFSLAATKGNQP